MKSGWQTKKLGKVCFDAEWNRAPEGSVPYVEIGDINVDTKEIISKEKGSVKGSVFAPLNSVIVSRVRPTRGAISILEKDAVVSSAFTILKPRDLLKLRLLFFSLAYSKEFSDYLREKQKGLLYPSVKEEDVLDFEISYPESLPEQQRIIQVLDKVFEEIAKAQTNTEKSLQNVRALFESHLQNVFTQRGKGWMEKPLGVICDFSQGVQVDVKLQSESKENESQVRFLRIVDFTQGNEPERYIDNPGKKFLVCQSDISLVRYGASTGFVCRGLDGVIANNLFRVIPKEGQVSNEFLYWFLKSPAFQDEIKRIMNGAAMPAISFGVINEIPVSFPPQHEQPAIVNKLDSFSAETQRLAGIYERKLAALEALKKSLLHQAFTGEL